MMPVALGSNICEAKLTDSGPKILNFTQSTHNNCVFYRGSTAIMVYTDDCLLGTRDKGMHHLRPATSNGFGGYDDANFCGNWDKAMAPEDPDTAKSQHSFILKLYGIPIYWWFKLQNIIAFSTAESEYIGLSTATRYVLGTIF